MMDSANGPLELQPISNEYGAMDRKGPVQLQNVHSTATHKMSKFQIIKNLLVLSVSFLFLFTAFGSLQNLQSSLNKEEGLGTVGLAIIYAAGVVCGIFLPPFAIGHLGCKWTLAASMVCYIVYMLANFHAVWATIVPASIIIGSGAATLWAAKCTYLTQIAVWYAELTNTTKDDIINRFFGVFFMIFQTAGVWGNLVSSYVFRKDADNSTVTVSDDILNECGANYCPASYQNNTNLDKPDLYKIYTLCGILVAFACVGILTIIIVLDRITLDKEEDKKDDAPRKGLDFHLLTEIGEHFWHSRYQKLLIPLTVYSGVEQGFISGDFTRSFVSCSLGIWNVGFTMIAFGATDAVCSFSFGRLVHYVGHIPIFFLAFVVHGGTQVFMLLWVPDPDKVYVFYVMAMLWGMGDAVIQTQVNALYGYLFTEKAECAFASYRLCESAGFILAFGYSSFLCTDVKLYICLACLVVGMAHYGVLEMLHRREKQKKTAK